MPPQAVAQRKQAQGHHTHEGEGRQQPLSPLQWPSFRAEPCRDGFVILLNQPAGGIRQRTGLRRRNVVHVGITPQDPLQSCSRVGGGGFPDAHGGARIG